MVLMPSRVLVLVLHLRLVPVLHHLRPVLRHLHLVLRQLHPVVVHLAHLALWLLLHLVLPPPPLHLVLVLLRGLAL